MSKTKQWRTLCAIALCIPFALSATNIRITGTTIEPFSKTDTTLFVRCTLAWDNAWHDQYNHDAAWIFLKFKPAPAEFNSRHLRVKPNGHGVLHAGADSPAATIEVSPDAVGLFVYPSLPYRGPVQWTLRLAFDPAVIGNFDPNTGEWHLHALEMALVPAGVFYLGDPEPEAIQAAAFFRSGADGQPDGPFPVTAEHQVIQIGDRPGGLNYRVRDPEYQGDRAGPIPAGFPKGVSAFYVMKYEITQGQYASFLNSLGTQASYFRANFSGKNYAGARGSIGFDGKKYSAQSPQRPLNFVSWDDGCAFADWAGLRPMTELEFEKACRGGRPPIPHEFPWGTSDKTQLARFVDRDDELKFKPGVDESQLRPDNRAVFGAAACGALDLAGSLWERVVSAGSPAGRAFRGTHGDGRTDGYGSATNTDWPRGDDERGPGGFGYRGGGYYEHGKPEGDFNPHSPIGWRNFAAWAGGPRSIAYGFRCVRSVVPKTANEQPADAGSIIRTAIADFSKNLVAGNFNAVVDAYCPDAKIFPPGLDILAGADSIRTYWTPRSGATSKIVYHKVLPEEISIAGNTAYDWGYYEGSSKNEAGEISNWRGKYVIVWKETTPGVWKIYLDCWNRTPN